MGLPLGKGFDAHSRIQDMPGIPPSFTLLIAISNAPLAMPRMLVYRYLPGWWDAITLVVGDWGVLVLGSDAISFSVYCVAEQRQMDSD